MPIMHASMHAMVIARVGLLRCLEQHALQMGISWICPKVAHVCHALLLECVYDFVTAQH